MARYKAINLSFAENWDEEYKPSEQSGSKEESVEEKSLAATEHGHDTAGKTRSKTLPRKMVRSDTKPPSAAAKPKKTS